MQLRLKSQRTNLASKIVDLVCQQYAIGRRFRSDDSMRKRADLMDAELRIKDQTHHECILHTCPRLQSYLKGTNIYNPEQHK